MILMPINSWATFKTTVITNKMLPLQYTETAQGYDIFGSEAGLFIWNIFLPKNNDSDVTDFEDNYKAEANKKIEQVDTDNALMVRNKAAKKGWSFWALPVEIRTSTIDGSLYCKDATGEDIPGLICKIYDDEDDEITTPGVANANLLTCVKTVLDYEPSFDYEIIGGELRVNSTPSQDIRMWVVGAPDIPVEYGGSREFVSGVNLKFMSNDSGLSIDGRVTKYIEQDASTHKGKIRIVLKHPAGTQINLQFVIHMYKL